MKLLFTNKRIESIDSAEIAKIHGLFSKVCNTVFNVRTKTVFREYPELPGIQLTLELIDDYISQDNKYAAAISIYLFGLLGWRYENVIFDTDTVFDNEYSQEDMEDDIKFALEQINPLISDRI